MADPSGAVAYLFGGVGSTGPVGDLWAYDMGGDEWSPVQVAGQSVPIARRDHAAVWVDGAGLVVMGGVDRDGTVLGDIWRFDPEAGGWTEQPGPGRPPARSGGCLTQGPDGLLWLIGGRGADERPLADAWSYDLAADSWSERTPTGSALPPRTDHACWWTDDERLVVLGGSGVEGVLGDGWSLTLEGDPAWAPIAATDLVPRSDAAVTRQADRLLAIAGVGADGAAAGGAVALDATTLAATEYLPGADGPAAFAGAMAVDDPAAERVLVFGGSDGVSPLGDLWEVDLPRSDQPG